MRIATPNYYYYFFSFWQATAILLLYIPRPPLNKWPESTLTWSLTSAIKLFAQWRALEITNLDSTCRERVATAGIESWTSSPGVARSTDWATAPPISMATKRDPLFKTPTPAETYFRCLITVLNRTEHFFSSSDHWITTWFKPSTIAIGSPWRQSFLE